MVEDTHVDSPSGLEVTKKTRLEKPDQKIVLVTAMQMENLSKECSKTAGIKDNDTLKMPFRLSRLVSAFRDH
ncbi:hypothetical protein E5N71_03055 [Candidatus Nitrosocosmicus sp. SS]|nr:hypothetical protein F1Z66_07780 [Candidatus Nitrosocosmicus sp. SS]KAF0869746.1 hypothetical protein E5N71_03055 [Candidatus Nitrosocosmicus sp. SS]